MQSRGRQRWRAAIAAGAVLVATSAALAGASAVPAAAAAKPKAVVTQVRLAVGPARVFVTAGDKPAVRTWTVRNTGNTTVTVTMRVRSVSEDRAGQLRLTAPKSGSGAGWLSPATGSFTLAARHARKVKVRIDVPAAARGTGERDLAVQFQAVPLPGQPHGPKKAVRLRAAAAGQLFLTAPGPVVHRVTYRVRAPGFTGDQEIGVSLTIADQGTAHVLAGRLTTAGSGQPTRFPPVLLLGGSVVQRTRNVRAPALCLPCHVTVAGQTVTVWGVPVVAAGGITLVLIGLGISVLLVHRGARRRRRRPPPVPSVAQPGNPPGLVRS